MLILNSEKGRQVKKKLLTSHNSVNTKLTNTLL